MSEAYLIAHQTKNEPAWAPVLYAECNLSVGENLTTTLISEDSSICYEGFSRITVEIYDYNGNTYSTEKKYNYICFSTSNSNIIDPIYFSLYNLSDSNGRYACSVDRMGYDGSPGISSHANYIPKSYYAAFLGSVSDPVLDKSVVVTASPMTIEVYIFGTTTSGSYRIWRHYI